MKTKASPNFKLGEEVLFPIDEDSFLRGTIMKFIRSTGEIRVEDTATGDLYDVDKGSVEKIISNDVNWRFEYYEHLAALSIYKEIKSIFVAGEGGLGKSYTVQQVLDMEEFVEDKDYVYIKGHVSPFALYKTLHENHDKPIIFDDCDGILKVETSLNILKAVIDTYSKRRVKWMTALGPRERIVNSFDFTGSIIFLSNLPIDKVPQAILSRTVLVDVSMTPQEKIERMRHIIKTMPEMDEIAHDDKERLISLLNKYKLVMKDFNLRSLVKAAIMFQKTGKWDFVETSILDS